MEINFKFTDSEKELLLLFKEKESLSTHNDFDGWRGKAEFDTLSSNKLIHHYNRSSEGDYIRYQLTDLGHLAVKSLLPKTKVKVEFFKDGGKWYTNFEYLTNLKCFELEQIKIEASYKKEFIKGMNFTIEVDTLNSGWNKYLFLVPNNLTPGLRDL